MFLQQPLILALAAIAAIALVLAYYLQRRRAPRVVFSAVRFLPSSSRARTARAALPPAWLLIPVSILALATMSVAQPTLSRRQPPPLALIVDDSAFAPESGQDGLTTIAATVSAKATSTTRWGLFTTSGQTVGLGMGAKSLTSLLESYTAPAARPSYSPAIFNQAVELLKERAGATPVVVLVGNTDTFLAYPGLDSVRAEMEKAGAPFVALASRGSARPTYIAATDTPRLARLGSEVRARVAVANTTSDDINGELRLSSNGDVLLRAPARLPAQSLKWQELRITPRNGGDSRYQIDLAISGKGGAEDTVVWEVATYTKQHVLVLASAPNSVPGYVEKALKASPLVDSVTVVEPESLDLTRLRQLLATSRVVVLDGVDSAVLPIDLGVEMKGWVESGGTLVFAAGNKVTDAWKRNAVGLVLPAAIKTRKNTLLQAVTFKDHPITRNLELQGTPISVSQWLTLDRPSPEQTLISVGGEPMLLMKKAKEGTVLLWASTTDPRWNNWARYPSFPVFWSNVVEYAISGGVKPGAERQDNTRVLLRAPSSSASGEKIHYVDYRKGEPVALPAAFEGSLDRPATGYRDYHVAFLAASAVLALGYVWSQTSRKRGSVP